MLIAKWVAATKSGRLGATLRRLHSTSGGSSDSDENELAVRPTLRPSAAHVVITVTPVGNCPNAARNCSGSRAGRSVAVVSMSVRTLCSRIIAAQADGSNHHGENRRGSSKPSTIAAASDGNWPAAPSSSRMCGGGGVSSELVQRTTCCA